MKLAAVLEATQNMYQKHSACKRCKWKNSLEQLMIRNKNGFFKLFKKNIASGTSHTSTMIDVDEVNDYFANIGKSLASVWNCSILRDTKIPQPIDKTIFLYPMDSNEFYSSIKNCKTTKSSLLDCLSNNLLKIAGPVISDFLATKFNRCTQVKNSPNVL